MQRLFVFHFALIQKNCRLQAFTSWAHDTPKQDASKSQASGLFVQFCQGMVMNIDEQGVSVFRINGCAHWFSDPMDHYMQNNIEYKPQLTTNHNNPIPQ